MTRVHVWGASGYAAAEAIRLIDAHPLLEVGVLESRSHAGERIGNHFPLLRTTPYVFSGGGSVLEEIGFGDVVIAAGQHGEAGDFVPRAVSQGARVVDLSADLRFDDKVAYGLSEWHRAEIADAVTVANPGCYPTATLLAVLPLLNVTKPTQLIVDAKSGITGAGRKPSTDALFAEVSGDVRAYGLGGHRHQPEIERILKMHSCVASVVFTPHVVPIVRGMLVDTYVVLDAPADEGKIRAAYANAYIGSPFVRVLDSALAPSVSAMVGTNDAELHVDVYGNVVRVICAIDNLGKGAAGQAIQNINIMLGHAEETGFHARAILA